MDRKPLHMVATMKVMKLNLQMKMSNTNTKVEVEMNITKLRECLICLKLLFSSPSLAQPSTSWSSLLYSQMMDQ